MQRHVVVLVAYQYQRLAHQRVALLDVQFDFHGSDHLVELGVADATLIEAAVRAGGLGVRQRLQHELRVEGRHAPAQHVGAGVQLQQLRNVGGEGHGVQLYFQARARPHRYQCLADFLVVHIAVVRAVQRELETVRIAGLGQQLLRLRGIERRHLIDVLGPGMNLRRHHQPRGYRQPAHRHALDRLAVDRNVERVPYPLVLERVLALHIGVLQLAVELVQPDENGPVFGAVDHLELWVRAQPRHVLRRQVGHHVDVAGEQRCNARRVGLDRRVDHFGDVAVALAPPVRIGDQHDALVGFPALDHVGAGAVGIARGEGLFPVLEVLDVLRLGFLRPGLAHDGEDGQVAQEYGVRAVEDEIDRRVVDLADFLDAVDVNLHVALRLQDAAVGERHVVRGERAAVVELDALAQVEAPLRRRDLLPAGGQPGLQLEFLVVANQRLVTMLLDGDGGGVVLRMRIERQDIVLRRPFERDRRCREGIQRRGEQRGKQEWFLHGASVRFVQPAGQIHLQEYRR